SIALGVFIGIIPVWGFQTFLSIFLAAVLKGNKALSFLGSNISIPPMIPFIVWGSLQIGGLLIPGAMPLTIDFEHISWQALQAHLLQYLVGSLILATFTSVILGIAVYMLLSYYQRKSIKNV
ncbi:MAG: DUF2062 domain-containing protein, partial [Myroides sp.]|nr:DUF2062 domain-containing protein [Myroides sp.]